MTVSYATDNETSTATYLLTSIIDRSTTTIPIGSSLLTLSKSKTLITNGMLMSSIGTQNFSFH